MLVGALWTFETYRTESAVMTIIGCAFLMVVIGAARLWWIYSD